MLDLSLRLKTIASLVPPGARVCDVGTDHGYLPIYLKQNNIAKSVIATDLNQKPLKNAEMHLLESKVSDISLRLCDGLSAVTSDEADTIIVAGMGGEVITHILGVCEWIKHSGITLILQPTTSAEILRKFLYQNGFEIAQEIPVFENKKLYSVMVVKFTSETANLPEYFYYIGKIPLDNDGILYIKKQYKRVFECMKSLEKIESKQAEYKIYKSVCDYIEKLLTENDNGI